MIQYQYYCKECGYKREGLLDRPAIGIGSYSTVCPECNGQYDSYIKSTLEFWTVENTGWSGGLSWFKTGGTDANPLRFTTREEADAYAIRSKELMNDPNTKWRVVRTTIEREDNREVIAREWDAI